MLRAFCVLLAIASGKAGIPSVLSSERSIPPKIILGEDANSGEYPFIVSLRYMDNTPGHNCGGTILTSNWVLTAAHCCVGIQYKRFYAYAGSIFLSKGGSIHPFERVIVHPSYGPFWKNDLCLIRVFKPFAFDKNVQQVKLPKQGMLVGGGETVHAAGWGFTTPEGKIPPDRLQKGLNYKTFTNEDCGPLIQMPMFQGYLCAMGKSSGYTTWNGDSGGPLMKNDVEVGVTSFGFRPYGGGKPTVYVRLPLYIDWIKKELGNEATQLKFT